MAYLSGVRFPDSISYGSRGGPMWRNTRVELDSGAAQGIQRWSVPRREYDVRWGIRDQDDYQDVVDLWMQTRGSINGFGFRDLLDYSTKPENPDRHTGTFDYDDQNIGTGDGSTTQFQIVKAYTVGSHTFSRIITKPLSGGKVGVNGVEQVSGFTISEDSGIVTFTTAPPLGQMVTAGCNYDVPVQFAPELDGGFSPTLAAFDAAALDQIRLVEMIGDVITPQRYWHGGGSEQTLTATTAYEFSWGAAVVFNLTTAQSVLLPDPTTLDAGIPYHTFENAGSATITFKTHDDASTYFTLTAGSYAQTFIYPSAGVNTWGAHQ